MMGRLWIRFARPPELMPAGQGPLALVSGVTTLAWPAQDLALRLADGDPDRAAGRGNHLPPEASER